MSCAEHPDVETAARCAVCKKELCVDCVAFEVDQGLACAACGQQAEERAQALGTGVVALVATSYLATLAIGVLVFHPRPFIGGLAAVVAIAAGRALQLAFVPTAIRRSASDGG